MCWHSNWWYRKKEDNTQVDQILLLKRHWEFRKHKQTIPILTILYYFIYLPGFGVGGYNKSDIYQGYDNNMSSHKQQSYSSTEATQSESTRLVSSVSILFIYIYYRYMHVSNIGPYYTYYIILCVRSSYLTLYYII